MGLEKKLIGAIEADVSKVENGVHGLIASDLKELEDKLDKRANNYIIVVCLLTAASGFGFWLTNDLAHFIIEVLPTTGVALIVGYLFLKKSDETVKTSTSIIHKSLSSELATLHSKLDRLIEQKKADPAS